MKQLILSILASGTTRRLAVLALTPLALWANRRFQLEIPIEGVALFVLAQIAHVVQSAWKEKGKDTALMEAVARAASEAQDPKTAVEAVLTAAGRKP